MKGTGAKTTGQSHFFPRSPSGSSVEYADTLLRAGRPAEVIALLNDSPIWGAPDLGEILTTRAHNQAPLGYIAASAFDQQGDKKTARRILNALILQSTSYDPAYELLLRLETADTALALVEASAARDPFEERPLIWKADLLRQKGELAAAEETIKKAIGIDPSDGEVGRYRRMKAYQVWGAIAKDQGDDKTVEFLVGVDRAIRMAEDADRFIQAGLLDEGIARYEKALGYFSDAYCIQSRLAIQLSDQGRWEEAEAHYRKAYELMPDSFGRMESHCLGCEGAFRGEKAPSIAEQTFEKLLAANPDKPQLHYLLGYLREQQQRYPEALGFFQEAVRLDPDYLNAWKHNQGIDRHDHLSREVRDRAIRELYRLNPSGKYAKADLSKATDLAALWKTVATYGQPDAESAALYPLPAAKAWIDEKEKQENMVYLRKLNPGLFGNQAPQQPGDAIAINSVLQGFRCPLVGDSSNQSGEARRRCRISAACPPLLIDRDGYKLGIDPDRPMPGPVFCEDDTRVMNLVCLHAQKPISGRHDAEHSAGWNGRGMQIQQAMATRAARESLMTAVLGPNVRNGAPLADQLSPLCHGPSRQPSGLPLWA